MPDRPRVVVSTKARPARPPAEFNFTRADVPRETGSLGSYRDKAWAAYVRQALPNVTEEAWRRTDLGSMPAGSFQLSPRVDGRLPAPPSDLLQPLAADQHGGQVIATPGETKIDLAPDLSQQGVVFTDLRTAEAQHPEVVERILGATVNVEEGKFAAMAAALAETGVLLYVPPNVRLEQPLHSVLWGPGGGRAYMSHILVFVDDGASVTYVHESASPTETTDSLHSGIVEIKVGSGAQLRFVELQSWGQHMWNFTHERVRVGRDATLDWIFGAIGSKLTKNFSELDLAGEGSTGRMSGFYFTDGSQHLDHDTQQNHLAPHTTSDLLFKGALKGHSRSVWQGMIYVAPGAEKTDGYQANRNLILDEGARADSIPGLEILADDVRCTHGATVGKLEEEPLFYLESRGIPPAEATRLAVEGFFDPIMQRIPFVGVRERFQSAIVEKMA
jgi:Fe-S cluster assembly protein SufD